MRGVALPGCDAATLGGYLAGLGVLRLVAGQRERAACGHWRGGVFVLTSSLEAGEREDESRAEATVDGAGREALPCECELELGDVPAGLAPT